jgi:hypothetical protein
LAFFARCGAARLAFAHALSKILNFLGVFAWCGILDFCTNGNVCKLVDLALSLSRQRTTATGALPSPSAPALGTRNPPKTVRGTRRYNVGFRKSTDRG